jgi:hypothetical protein
MAGDPVSERILLVSDGTLAPTDWVIDRATTRPCTVELEAADPGDELAILVRVFRRFDERAPHVRVRRHTAAAGDSDPDLVVVARSAAARLRPPDWTVSTVIVPDAPTEGGGAVVVAIGRDSAAQVAFGADAARRGGLPLTLLRVVEVPQGPARPSHDHEQVDAQLGRMLLDVADRQVRRDHPDLRHIALLEHGDLAELLLDASTHAGLLVLGSGRRPLETTPRGRSTVFVIAAHSSAPVVVVPHGSRSEGDSAIADIGDDDRDATGRRTGGTVQARTVPPVRPMARSVGPRPSGTRAQRAGEPAGAGTGVVTTTPVRSP